MKEINQIIDLKNLTPSSDVTGISNVERQIRFMDNIDQAKGVIKLLSRGEFAGYFTDGNQLILFRDRIGGRNLYFCKEDNIVLISTNPKWIVENMKTIPSIHEGYLLNHYIPFQIPSGPLTIYKGVEQVPPATMVIIDPYESRIRYDKYWEMKFGNQQFNPNHLLFLIRDSIEFRKKYIPEGSMICSYLSGGIDSSSITILSKVNDTFSGYYEDERYSELNYISAIKREDLDKIFVKIDQALFHKYLSLLNDIMPDPMCGYGIIPQTIIAMAAFRAGFHYAFTGEGGDEIFCGYPWNWLVYRNIQAMREMMNDRYTVRWEPMIEKFINTAYPSMIVPLISRRIFPYNIDTINRYWSNESPENNIMKLNVEWGLPAILTVDEAVGRFSGVEPISPLIDHNIVEYVASIDYRERMKIPKHLLREAMGSLLPDKIRNRYDKMGFPVPVEKWQWPMVRPLMESLMKRGIINVPLWTRTMDRDIWGLINIEMVARFLDDVRRK